MSLSNPFIDQALYYAVWALLKAIQALPLTWVARLGRICGGLAFILDGRHRRVALNNLNDCFGAEKTADEIHAIARENFHRIGENFACLVKTAAMSPEALRHHIEFVGVEKIVPIQTGQPPQSRIVAIGHFGNFELYGRFAHYAPAYKCAVTYRGLPQPSLNRLLQSLRARSGCQFFERRTDASALKAAMNQGGMILGLLADQHAGDGGLRLPFFGRDCSTSAAPAIFALRYHCHLHTGICYRTQLAHWRIEAGDEIPTRVNGQPRSVEDISLDINSAFEKAVRRDPANWFWVHRRWKLSNRKTS